MTEKVLSETKQGAETPTVFQALQAVMREMKAVGKDSINEQQRFKFRGIDAVMNSAHPLFAEHGVLCVPNVLERLSEQRETKAGGSMNVVHLRVQYTFYGPSGDSVAASVWGEAQDSADKATNKALAAAFKYALFQTLCIPTEDQPDADATTVEASKASDADKIAEIELAVDQATTVAELRVAYSTVTLAWRAKQVTPADKKKWHELITERSKALEAAPIAAADLPKNSNGSVSHSQAMPDDLAAVGIMTAEQRKEHNALQENGKVQWADQALNDQFLDNAGAPSLDLPKPESVAWCERWSRELADCVTPEMVKIALDSARGARRDNIILAPQLSALVGEGTSKLRELNEQNQGAEPVAS